MRTWGKINQANYDRAILASDASEECCYCLTNGQVRALLAQTEYLAWATRWYSPTNAEIDTDQIQALSDDLIRRLFMGCGESQIVERRIDPVTGYVQERRNGGDWQISPDDPRIGHPSPVPPVTSGIVGTKCDAAVNVVQYLRDVVVEALEAKATSQNLTAFILVVAAVIMAIFVSGQWYLIPIILEPLASLYWGWEASRILLAMDTQTYDEFQCIVFCHIQDDGSFTDGDYEAILADIQTKITETDARRFISEHVKVWKAKGLSLAAAHGIRDGSDCSDCECGGCDLSNWIIAIGTEVSRTSTEVVIDAVRVGGEGGDYHINFYSPADNICCCNVQQVSEASIIAVKACGLNRLTEDGLNFSYIPGSGVSINRMALVKNAPFTATITADPCA